MLTEEELKGLLDFGKEDDGSYSDRWQFTIKKNPKKEQWSFFFFCEVDGSLYFIKYLKDLNDLKNVYFAITDKELSYDQNHALRKINGWGS